MAPTRSKGPKTVEEYFAGVPEPYRAELERLRRTIRKAAPKAEEVLSYAMPAFRQGRILVYYAAFKDHLSLFVASPGVRRRFATELRPFEAGRGTLRFTPEKRIPADLVARIIRARIAENAARSAR